MFASLLLSTHRPCDTQWRHRHFKSRLHRCLLLYFQAHTAPVTHSEVTDTLIEVLSSEVFASLHSGTHRPCDTQWRHGQEVGNILMLVDKLECPFCWYFTEYVICIVYVYFIIGIDICLWTAYKYKIIHKRSLQNKVHFTQSFTLTSRSFRPKLSNKQIHSR